MSVAATLLTGETISLDGAVFEDCEFRDCRLVYAGGETPVFRHCRFHGCD